MQESGSDNQKRMAATSCGNVRRKGSSQRTLAPASALWPSRIHVESGINGRLGDRAAEIWYKDMVDTPASHTTRRTYAC
jgi:hypothetical protein